MNYVALIFYSVITLPYFFLYVRKNRITPVSTFLLFQMIMFYGICFSEKGMNSSAHKLQFIYCVAIFCFIVGVESSKRIVFKLSKDSTTQICNTPIDTSNRSLNDISTNSIQKIVIWSIIALSILLCGLLFVRNGGNLFVQALNNYINDSNISLSEARKDYTDVNGVGYIYQFRAVLLPLLASFMLFFDKKKHSRLITIPIYILMITFLLGTGQRNAFVYYCFFVLIYIIMMKKDHGLMLISKPQMIILGIIAMLFLIILTISNGRVNDNQNTSWGAIKSLIDRVFSVNQESAIVGFEYMDSQDTVWGYDWWKMFEQLLPGKSDYIPVDYISYKIVYGTLRGTNPPCLWGSAWYNFHIFGITVFPFILGILYEKLHKTTISYKNKDRLYVLIYAGLCTYLGIWTSGTPMAVFNNGVVTLLILRWLCYKMPTIINKNKTPHKITLNSANIKIDKGINL